MGKVLLKYWVFFLLMLTFLSAHTWLYTVSKIRESSPSCCLVPWNLCRTVTAGVNWDDNSSEIHNFKWKAFDSHSLLKDEAWFPEGYLWDKIAMCNPSGPDSIQGHHVLPFYFATCFILASPEHPPWNSRFKHSEIWPQWHWESCWQLEKPVHRAFSISWLPELQRVWD